MGPKYIQCVKCGCDLSIYESIHCVYLCKKCALELGFKVDKEESSHE